MVVNKFNHSVAHPPHYQINLVKQVTTGYRRINLSLPRIGIVTFQLKCRTKQKRYIASVATVKNLIREICQNKFQVWKNIMLKLTQLVSLTRKKAIGDLSNERLTLLQSIPDYKAENIDV